MNSLRRFLSDIWTTTNAYDSTSRRYAVATLSVIIGSSLSVAITSLIDATADEVANRLIFTALRMLCIVAVWVSFSWALNSDKT